MSLATPDRIRQLQRKLYLKAKTEPSFRFYLLYDKVYRSDILEHAYLLAKANGGSAGVDGMTFDDIEQSGRQQWLAALGGELRDKTYKPQPVRRVMIPKPGGGERPLGIPGTPQGGVVSPLLANIYFNRFLRHWERRGMGQKLRARVINYADDFVIVSCGKAAEALAWTRRVMAGLGLRLNESKTCVRDVRRERFDFLGYTFAKVYNVYQRKHYLAACPSDKSVRRLKQKLRAALAPWNTGPWDEVAARVNRMLRGWGNYFSYGTLKRAYRAVDNHVFERVRHCLRRRHKLHSGGSRLLPSGKCLGRWGVERLRERLMHLRGHTHALG